MTRNDYETPIKVIDKDKIVKKIKNVQNYLVYRYFKLKRYIVTFTF